MIIKNDCLIEMKKMKEGSVDLIITDPPYNLNRFEGDSFTEEEFKKFCLNWLNECYRILKENKLLFFTFWSDGMYEMYNIIKQTPFNFIQTLIWYYPNVVGYKGKQQYTRSFDPIFVLSKSKPVRLKLNKGVSSVDCWNILKIAKPQSNFKKDKAVHPTQKPVELFIRIIEENSEIHSLVLDPFAGAGTTGIACIDIDRKYILIEKDEKYHQIIKNRISEFEKCNNKTFKLNRRIK